MNKIGELPDELIELPGRKSFEELTNAERGAILRHVTAEEYSGLHEAACLAMLRALQSTRRESLRREMMDAYQGHFAPDRINRRGHGLYLAWSAAALLVFILSFIGLRQVLGAHAAESGVITIRDTIFVSRPAEQIVMYDTVYLKADRVRSALSRETQHADVHPASWMQQEKLGVVGIREYSSEENALKGNSLSEDSLAAIFEFVQL